ncbi:hypothetical protein ACPCG0_04860 [Propionibacteriaceae bacterium Y1923]
MTPEQRELVKQLARYQGHIPISRDEFLNRYPATDGAQLGRDLLREAIADRDPTRFVLAMTLGDSFGAIDASLAPTLAELAYEDWHQSNEWVVDLLDDFRDPTTVPALL